MNVSASNKSPINFSAFKAQLDQMKADVQDLGKAKSVMESMTKELKDVFDKIEKLDGIQGKASGSVKDIIDAAKAEAMNAVAQALSQIKPEASDEKTLSTDKPTLKGGLSMPASGAVRSAGQDPIDVARPMAKSAPRKGNFGAGSLPSLGGKSGAGGLAFEDMIAAFMMEVMKEMQAEVEQSIKKYDSMTTQAGSGTGAGATGQAAPNGTGTTGAGTTGANDAAGANGGAGAESRQLMFEKIKQQMQKMSQMFQSLSNVLNTMHNNAMNTIRNIK